MSTKKKDTLGRMKGRHLNIAGITAKEEQLGVTPRPKGSALVNVKEERQSMNLESSSRAAAGGGGEEAWVLAREKEISIVPPLANYCQTDSHQKVLELVLIQVLRTMGLSEQNIQNTVENVRENSAFPSRYLLDVGVQGSLSSLAMNVFAPYLKEQVFLSKIIKMQAVARGWSCRKLRNTYQTVYQPLGLDKRLPLFQEIIKFQRKFVCDLQLFAGNFQDTLSRYDGNVITEEETYALFGNLSQILKTNQSIYADLLSFREKEWPFIDGFTSVFWSFRETMTDYYPAASSFQYQRDTFDRLLLRSKFVQVLEANVSGAKVYIPKIFERVVNWAKDFQRLLEEYLAELPVSALLLSESCALKELIVVLKTVKSRVEQQLYLSTERARVRDVLRRVITEGFFLEDVLLDDEERRYLKEGEVVLVDLNGKKSKRHIFLFSDLLSVAKATGPDTYKMTSSGIFPLERASLVESEKSEQEKGEGKGFSFYMTPSEGGQSVKKFTATWNVEGELYMWMAKITHQIKVNRQIFGENVVELVGKEESTGMGLGIPSIIAQCISLLESRGMYISDLFIRCGNTNVLSSLKRMISRGKIPDISPYCPYVVANLLEDYLLALPDPLLTYSLCESLTGENLESCRIIEQMKDEKVVPLPNQKLIELLCTFFVRLVASPSNSLTFEIVTSRFYLAFFRTKIDLPKSEQTRIGESIVLRLLRSFESVGSALGLVVQRCETGNSFLNALGKARCSPSYTKFSPIAFREKEREKEKEKEEKPAVVVLQRGTKPKQTVLVDGKRKRGPLRQSVKRLQELGHELPEK